MVLDGQTGYLCDLDAEEFGNRLIELLDQPEFMKRMGQAGREHVMSHGSVQCMVTGYEDLIETIFRQKSQATDRAPEGLPTELESSMVWISENAAETVSPVTSAS